MELYDPHPAEPVPEDAFRVWCDECGADQFVLAMDVWVLFNYLDGAHTCEYCSGPVDVTAARLERWSRRRLVRWGLDRAGLGNLAGRP